MSKQARNKRPAVSVVPQNREAAAAQLRTIGEVGREVARLEADMNDALAEVKERFENAAAPKREQIAMLTTGLQSWCEANRDGIVAKGTKTADLGTGKVLWRATPPKVTARGVEAILERFKSLSLQRFIRTKEELNKEAMLAEPDVAATVLGVTIGSSGEEFVVGPFEAQLTAVAA